jgi:hypothetical protein
MEYLSAIIALIKAIPTFERMFQSLMLAYVKSQEEKFDREFAKAFAVLIAEKDQRLIEEVLGFKAGPPSNMDDTFTRDDV